MALSLASSACLAVVACSICDAGGVEPLRRVGEGLLGRVVGAGQVDHLAAEAVDDSAGVGLGVGQGGRGPVG